MYTILVVDDSKTNLQQINQILSNTYSVIPVLSGEMALRFLEKKKPNLILLDYMMPEMDGMETMKRIKENPANSSIPIIIMTADRQGTTEAECLSLGANDFITKPFIKEVMLSRIQKTIELESYHINLEQRLTEKSQQMELITLQAITVIAKTIDAKDESARGHSIRVAQYAAEIASKLGWPEEEIQNIQYVGLLHDIGKIGVSDTILNKPTKLTPAEYEIMKSHTIIGGEIVKDIKLIHQVREGTLSHHERYDGKGYPNGLSGENIPLIARILTVADAYDAMTSERIYREKLTKQQAMKELEEGSGTQFDPHIVTLFLEMLEHDGISVKVGEKVTSFQSSFIEESSLLLQRVIEERDAKVKIEASRDHLTGLNNRRAAEIKINQFIMNKEKKGAFFIMDIDNFKLVNDNFGHIAGDYVLKKMATVLLENARDSDIVCRLGGDEFVIFFKGVIQRDFLKRKAEKLISDFTVIRSLDETMKETSLSIGIALLGIDGEDFEHLYVKADKSLYYVKQNGKGSYHFYSEEDGVHEDENPNSTIMDIQHLMDMMRERGEKGGVLIVEYSEFQRIYGFIQRCVDRTKQEVQVLLFTLSHRFGEIVSSEAMEDCVHTLENAIFQSLRRSDVSTRYSNSQFIIVLINSNYNGAELVVSRVSSIYNEMNKHNYVILSTDIAQMELDNEVE